MLFRTPESLDTDFSAIKKKMDADYSAYQSLWHTYWTEASLNTRLEAGDVTLMGELGGTNASLAARPGISIVHARYVTWSLGTSDVTARIPLLFP